MVHPVEAVEVRLLGGIYVDRMYDDGYVDVIQHSCSRTSLTCAGFDFGIAGTVTAFPAFQQAMGRPDASQASGYLIPAHVQSGWSGVSTLGDFLGVFISGQLRFILTAHID